MSLAFAAALVLLSVVVAILGNWLKPPAKLTSRAIAGLFVAALVAYLGIAVHDRLSTDESAAGDVSATPTAKKPPANSPYVDAARFVRFGDRHGIFTLDAAAGRLQSQLIYIEPGTRAALD
jgi:hypothetical protein